MLEVEQFEMFPAGIHLRRIDPRRNMHRFYSLSIQMELFGGVTLIREWGRMGSAEKVCKSHHTDEGYAIDTLLSWVKAKQRKGYQA